MLLTLKFLEGRQRNKRTRVYSLNLTDMPGVKHNLQAIGLECITEVGSMPEVKKLSGVFPRAENEARSAFSRPHGRIAMASRALHCS